MGELGTVEEYDEQIIAAKDKIAKLESLDAIPTYGAVFQQALVEELRHTREVLDKLRQDKHAAEKAFAAAFKGGHGELSAVKETGLQELADALAKELREMYENELYEKPTEETRGSNPFHGHIRTALERLREHADIGSRLSEVASQWRFFHEGESGYHNPLCDGKPTNPDFSGLDDATGRYAVIEAKYDTLSHKPTADRYIGQQLRYLGAGEVDSVMLIAYAEPDDTSEEVAKTIEGALGTVGPTLMRSVAVAVVYPSTHRSHPMASLFNADAIDDEASGNDDELEDFEDLDDEDDGQGSYLGREEDDDELFVLEHNNEFEGCDSINHPDCIDPLKDSALKGNRRLWDLWEHLKAEKTVLRRCFFDVPMYMRHLYDRLANDCLLKADEAVPESLAGGSTQMGKTMVASSYRPPLPPVLFIPLLRSSSTSLPFSHTHSLGALPAPLSLAFCTPAAVCCDWRVRSQTAGRCQRMHHS